MSLPPQIIANSLSNRNDAFRNFLRRNSPASTTNAASLAKLGSNNLPVAPQRNIVVDEPEINSYDWYLQQKQLETSAGNAIAAVIVPNKLSVPTGELISFNVFTTNVHDGALLYWTINSNNSVVLADNELNPVESGVIVITDNKGSFAQLVYPTSAPLSIFTITIRTDSTEGTGIVTSEEITVLEPQYIFWSADPGPGTQINNFVVSTTVPSDFVFIWWNANSLQTYVSPVSTSYMY